MKKILFLIHTLGVGGAEKVLINLVNNMDKSKYDITVMTVIDTGIFKESIDHNVHYKTIFKIPFKKKKNSKVSSGSLHSNFNNSKLLLKKIYQFFWRHMNTKLIYKVFIKDYYDYEVAFLEGVATKIIASSIHENSKKYAWIHVDLINEKKSEYFYKSINDQIKDYIQFNKIICVSNVVKEQAEKKLGLETEKFITLYNPIDTNEIIKKANQEIVNTNNAVTFCSVGRLAQQKGYDRLIKVSNKLKEEGLSFSVNILGEGPDKKQLEQLIDEYNLKDYVYLLGFCSNPYPYIKNCDVFICPSRAEGFSTVASEAVVLNKACLVTDCSGMSELFGKESEYGYIVSNDEKGIYEGMKLFLTNEKMRDVYSQKSKENSIRFNLKNTIEDIQERLFNE